MSGLLILDRDGVLNEMVIEPEQGTVDSPLHSNQVQLVPGVPEALARLHGAGFALVIASNQPAVAKGKTTKENLDAVHAQILSDIQAKGAKVLSSELCFHRREDLCLCRKPGIGLLQTLWARHPGFEKADSWMIGDGVTDVQAGARFGVKTAFLGPRKCDACKVFEKLGIKPDFWGSSLVEFTDFLLGQ
ncbi:HAD-IIIA family hydrolase [Bdellovibrionota bacterium FG-2]